MWLWMCVYVSDNVWITSEQYEMSELPEISLDYFQFWPNLAKIWPQLDPFWPLWPLGALKIDLHPMGQWGMDPISTNWAGLNIFESKSLSGPSPKLAIFSHLGFTLNLINNQIENYYFLWTKSHIFSNWQDSDNFSLAFDTVFRALTRRIKILAFSNFNTWESSILTDFFN